MREQTVRGNVVVANLRKGYTGEESAKRFDACGIVVGGFLAGDPATGASKRHGLVNIAPERAASEAVAALNGMDIRGCPPGTPPPPPPRGPAQPAPLGQPPLPLGPPAAPAAPPPAPRPHRGVCA